jgi:hypothetical protein
MITSPTLCLDKVIYRLGEFDNFILMLAVFYDFAIRVEREELSDVVWRMTGMYVFRHLGQDNNYLALMYSDHGGQLCTVSNKTSSKI